MLTVEFIRLRKPEKAKHLCELAEEFHNAGKRVVVTVVDDDQGVKLDHYMWQFRRDAFLPHAFDNGAVDCLDEPVVICSSERNANAGKVLIMGKPCRISFMRQFELVVDFAELHDESLAAAARQRFRSYQEAGLAPRMRE